MLKAWAGFKKVIVWSLLFIVVTIAGSIGKNVVQAWMRPSNKETLSQIVSQAAQKANALTPTQIDEITRLDRVEAVDGYKMRMYHTLLYYQARAKDFNIKQVQAGIAEELCTKQTRTSLLSLGFVWEYVYKQENGEEVGRFDIGATECSSM